MPYLTPSSNTPVDPWHLLGVGSLGGLWAARLSSRVPVRLLMRRNDRSTQRITLIDGETVLAPELPVESSQAPGTELHHLLVATKSYDTLAAIDAIAHRLTGNSRLYLMQNGLGSQEVVAEKYAHLPIYAVTTTEGANQRIRFEITHAGRGMTWIGPLTAGAGMGDAEACADLFGAVGFQSEATTDIREKLWRKLAVNCAINPFTAVLDCANGELPKQAFFTARIDGICQEIANAMIHAGYATSGADIRQRVFDVIAGTARNISSMLQDIRAGRPTEIAAINGYLSTYCETHGIPCPINRELVNLVSARGSV